MCPTPSVKKALLVEAEDFIRRTRIDGRDGVEFRKKFIQAALALFDFAFGQRCSQKLLGNCVLDCVRDRLAGALGKLPDHAIGFLVPDQYRHGMIVYIKGSFVYTMIDR